MPMAEDLDTFFDVDEHASRAWFDHAETDDNDQAILVILDAPYVDFDEQVASTNPVCWCKTADVTSIEYAIDKRLVIGTTTYRIRNARPIETGDLLQLDLEVQGNLG